jgi:folylpolyglutamate synthase
MKHIRERICINGNPISAKLFTTRFFEIWDKLPDHPTPSLDIPRYLQLLTLLSFPVFLEEKVGVAIYETHCGGEHDATNIIRTPVVTAVTSIAMDHVKLLGPTIEKIAWHKAGIFKSGSLAFSTLQEEAITTILQQRAAEKGIVLKFVGLDSTLPTNVAALKPKVQRTNCALALAVVRTWLSVKAPEAQKSMKDVVSQGLERFCWPGRYQQINEQNYQRSLDGAHNELSLEYAVQWFAETACQVQK